MKIMHEQISFTKKETIKVKWDHFPHFTFPWHFHSEFEMVYVLESEGTRFIADHMERFGPHDLVLLGSNLPHFYKNDEEYYQGNASKMVRAVIIQFPVDFFRLEINQYPEFSTIQKMLNHASRGIRFDYSLSKSLEPKFKSLVKKSGMDRLLLFLDILKKLSESKKYEILASEAWLDMESTPNSSRLNKVIRYLTTHYQKQITLEEIADIAGLTPTAFSKYFKNKTSKTFTEFVNEMRIGYACKLLIQGQFSATQAGLESGFNNVSYFNRVFKRYTGLTPILYREQYSIHNEGMKGL